MTLDSSSCDGTKQMLFFFFFSYCDSGFTEQKVCLCILAFCRVMLFSVMRIYILTFMKPNTKSIHLVYYSVDYFVVFCMCFSSHEVFFMCHVMSACIDQHFFSYCVQG